MAELWTPGDRIPIEPHQRRVAPTTRKVEGGSQFDDELDLEADRTKQIEADAKELMRHINERPDHLVYVSSTNERAKMQEVFDHWQAQGWIGHRPRIQVEYGLTEGSIRVAA